MWKQSSMQSYPRHYLEVSSQIHAAAAFTSWYSLIKDPQQSRSGRRGAEKNPCPWPESNLGRPVHSSHVMTELFRCLDFDKFCNEEKTQDYTQNGCII